MADNHMILLILQFIFTALAYDQLVVPNRTVAKLSSTYETYHASRAVDGNTTQDMKYCSHTGSQADIKEAWLSVDLNQIYSIKKVTFWYRETSPGTTRLPGYSIRVSNDSHVPSHEAICYQDPGTNISNSVIEKDCERTGQYIWIYQNNTIHSLGECPMLEICEIQVYGCETGKHGNYCNNTCDHCKNKDTCDIESGSCDRSGCAEINFLPPMCNECAPGFFGVHCRDNCSEFCSNMTCDRTTGNCLHGCDPGYVGDQCKQECMPGWYGMNCSMKCGHCSGSSACNRSTGACALGCDPGWQDNNCDIACSNGTFGKNCRFNCTQDCTNGEYCDIKDGSCPECPFGNHLCRTTDDKMDRSTKFTANGVVALSTLAVIVIFVLVFSLIRRKIQIPDRCTVEMTENTEQTETKDNLCIESSPDLGVYCNSLAARPGCIEIRDLLEKIHTLENAKEDNFEKEFNSIPYGEQPSIPCTVGKLPENLPKNRFKTTFPYDHSRIILQSLQKQITSMQATLRSVVHILRKPIYQNLTFPKFLDTSGRKVYIATQGPKSNTVQEFLQMMWQENVAVIAMVTSLTEGAKIKCESYWPETRMKKIVKGKFIIQLLSANEYANFTIRHLKFINKEFKASRHIVQLQYTTWPDHGTPTPLGLLVYYQYVSRAMEKYPEHILLVHCSAGIGRTGTFIALDALYRQGQKEGKINIVEYINTMREDRMNMIQNSEQYRLLYYVLYESFRYKGEVLSKDSFFKRVESDISSNQAVNLSSFRKDFMELNTMRPVFKEEEIKIGMLNLHLNMTNTVLPADEIRIILSPYVAGRGTYYNAVPLSTFTMRDSLIAAQYPVPGAAVDLIRLLVDQECGTLVSLNPLLDVPSSKEWLKTSADETSLGPYRIKFEPDVRLSDNVHKFTIFISAKLNGNWHKVHVYEVTTWNTEDVVPSNVNVLLDVVKFVQSIENVDPEHKMTILSRDGATGCGVFSAVYNAIQQLQQDEEVDMFTIVRQLQSGRPEMISDMSEYLFSCQAVAEYIKSEPENVYSNVDKDFRENKEKIYANA